MITLTEEAKTKISSMLSDADSSKALRVFIEPGGCSGFEYGMSIESPKEGDHCAQISGLHVAVCPDSIDYLKGSEIHFDDGLSGKGFEIRISNVVHCGPFKFFFRKWKSARLNYIHRDVETS